MQYGSDLSVLSILATSLASTTRTCKSIQFPSNSEIRTIGSNAFQYSTIRSFTIPPHLTTICEKAFSGCRLLQTFEIPANSELRTIESCAFSLTSIESLTIPPSLVDLKNG